MRRTFQLFSFVGQASATYCIVYILFFNIPVGNKIAIQKLQEKVVLEKDVIGQTIHEFDFNKTYDILFLGSSHCYRSFSPSLFAESGFDCYNLGSSSQTPLNSYVLLTRFIKNSKMVLFEVYPLASGLSGEECFLSMNASINDYSTLGLMTYHLNNLRCYNALTLKPLIDHYNRDKSFNITKTDKGYVETLDSAKKGITYERLQLNQIHLPRQLEYIEKIIDLCAKNNVEVVMLYAPVPKELTIDGEEEFVREIELLAHRERVTFYNFGRNHRLNSFDHFYDDDHMNKAGVYLFNKHLIELLEKEVLTMN